MYTGIPVFLSLCPFVFLFLLSAQDSVLPPFFRQAHQWHWATRVKIFFFPSLFLYLQGLTFWQERNATVSVLRTCIKGGAGISMAQGDSRIMRMDRSRRRTIIINLYAHTQEKASIKSQWGWQMFVECCFLSSIFVEGALAPIKTHYALYVYNPWSHY